MRANEPQWYQMLIIACCRVPEDGGAHTRNPSGGEMLLGAFLAGMSTYKIYQIGTHLHTYPAEKSEDSS